MENLTNKNYVFTYKGGNEKTCSILVFQFKDKNGERIGDGKIGHIDLMRCSVFFFLYRKWVTQNHHCGVSLFQRRETDISTHKWAT